jgi:sec-independent protein translocase protein TatC
MFELPIVILALVWLDIVTPQMLSRYRRYAVVILLVVCAFFTPPELSSLAIMFLPVYMLYEVSIVLSYILVRRRNKRAAKQEVEGSA